MTTETLASKAERGMNIARDYDLTILQSADIDDDGLIQKLEFAVGNVYEPAAGIYGGAVTPWFENATDAFAWCADNESFIKGMFGEEINYNPEVDYRMASDLEQVCQLCHNADFREDGSCKACQPETEPVRMAKCYLCKKEQPAVDGLCYSKRGEGEYDIIDCGCRGWD